MKDLYLNTEPFQRYESTKRSYINDVMLYLTLFDIMYLFLYNKLTLLQPYKQQGTLRDNPTSET